MSIGYNWPGASFTDWVGARLDTQGLPGGTGGASRASAELACAGATPVPEPAGRHAPAAASPESSPFDRSRSRELGPERPARMTTDSLSRSFAILPEAVYLCATRDCSDECYRVTVLHVATKTEIRVLLRGVPDCRGKRLAALYRSSAGGPRR